MIEKPVPRDAKLLSSGWIFLSHPHTHDFVLFDLILYVPSTIFQL